MAQRATWTSRASTGRSNRLVAQLLGLCVALLVALALALLFGSYSVSPAQLLAVLLAHLNLPHAAVSAQVDAIVWQIRLPHVIAAALVGAALALAGVLFQAVLRNPLADPYVIGTSAGAQLGVTLAFFLPIQVAALGFGTQQVAAFAGALATVLVVYALARSGGTVPVVTLILAGFVVSSFLISATTFLTYLGPNVSDRLVQVLNWTLGNVQDLAWNQLAIAAVALLTATLVALLLGHSLDLMLLGEDTAAHLGLRVERTKLVALIVASLLTGIAVTVAGVVAFVGLVVPHGVRLMLGPGHRLLLPASALAGAAFVVICDLLARLVVAPATVPLGVVTAVFGAPLFLHLLRRSRRAYSV